MPETTGESRSPSPPGSSRRLKGCLIVLGVVLLLGGMGLWILATHLGGIITSGVERYGPEFTGTAVTLSGVDVSLLGGSATLHNLTVANPEGYPDEPILSLGSASVQVDLAALSETKVIHLNTVYPRDLDIRLSTGPGGTNLGGILKRVLGSGVDPSGLPPVTIGMVRGENLHLSLLVASDVEERTPIRFSTAEAVGTPEDGSFLLKNVFISNPYGFKGKHAVILREVRIVLDPASYFASPLVIKEMHVVGLDAIFEGGPVRNNLKVINQELEIFNQAMGATESQPVVIQHLYLKEGTARISPTLLGGKVFVPVPVPSLHLTNVRADSPVALFVMVNKAVMEGAMNVTGTVFKGIGEGLKTVGKGIGSGVKKAGDATKAIGKKLNPFHRDEE